MHAEISVWRTNSRWYWSADLTRPGIDKPETLMELVGLIPYLTKKEAVEEARALTTIALACPYCEKRDWNMKVTL